MKAWILMVLTSCAKKTTVREDPSVAVAPSPTEMPEQTSEAEPSIEDNEDDTLGGVIGGEIGGNIGGTIGGEPLSNKENAHAVHWSSVVIKHKQNPTFPPEALKLKIKSVSCLVTFSIDKNGLPETIDIKKCPSIFHDSVRKAAIRWRFHPVQIKGKTVKAHFTLRVRFQHR